MNVFGTSVVCMSYLCPPLFIKRTQLKADAEDQCRLDLPQSNRKTGSVLTCLPSVALVAVAGLC